MKKTIKIYLFILLIIGINNCYCQYQGYTTDSDSLLVLKNGSIISLTSQEGSVKTGTIIIKADKIEEVFFTENTNEYANAKVIDLKGKYILPGLIDAHVHLATVPKKSRKENQKEVEAVLLKMINSGITTVRDMAGNAIILSDYARSSRLNQIPAPSIFYASQFAGPKYFNMTRRHSNNPEDKSDKPWAQTITDSTNIALAVARAKGSGATGIKIYSDLSAHLVKNIVEEANNQGLQAWSHSAVFPASPMQIANAKVNTMSHAWDIMYGLNEDGEITRESLSNKIDFNRLDRILLLMKKNKVILDPTNYIAENNNMNGVEIPKRAHELGVKVAVGTDWPYLYEPEIPFFKELKLLVDKCGFTNAEALYSATKVGAESIGLADRGTIEKGKKADIIIVNKNPLDHIENLKDIHTTIKSGIIYKKEKT